MKKVFLDTGLVTEKRQYESFYIESAFVQTYINSQELIFTIKSKSAIYLLLWMLSKMSDFNQITLDQASRIDFKADCIIYGKVHYSDSTIKKAIMQLVDAEAIVSMNEKNRRESRYMVNPAYFWKTGEQKDRIIAIKGFQYQLKVKKDEAN